MRHVYRGGTWGEWPDTACSSSSVSASPADGRFQRGFRLVHDGTDEYRFRRGRSFTVHGEESLRAISLEDYPEFQNARISIRLAADWRAA